MKIANRLFTLFLVATHLALSAPAIAANSKTTICHKPDKNGGNTITVSSPAVQKHIDKHGDYIGICATTVPTTGATLEVAGELTLAVPDGALEVPTDITIRRVAGEPGTVNAVYDLGPDGMKFKLPIEMRISYNPRLLPPGVDETDLFIETEGEGGFGTLESTFVDTDNSEVVGYTDHFTEFAVGYPYLSCGDEATVTGAMFDTNIAESFRLPLGDTTADTAKLLKEQPGSYPLISFNKDAYPGDAWYVATAFLKDEWLDRGWFEAQSPDFEAGIYCTSSSVCTEENQKTHPGEDWNIIPEVSGSEDEGKTVYSAADGIVLFSGRFFGYSLILGHKLEDGTYVATFYGHLQSEPSLCKGQVVRKGDPIGAIGNTTYTRNSSGERVITNGAPFHLHFEIAKGIGKMLDYDPVTDAILLAYGGKTWDNVFSFPDIIADRKLEPFQFIKDNSGEGELVYGSADGTVLSVSSTGNAVVPAGISPGDLVGISFRYDPVNSAVLANSQTFRSYAFPDGRPSGLDISIKGLTWSSSDDTSLPGNQFGFVALLSNFPSTSESSDSFTLGGRADESFPGGVSSSAENYLNFTLSGSDSSLLSGLELPISNDDIDLSTILIPENNGGGLGSFDANGNWFVSYQIDPQSFNVRRQKRGSCAGPECRFFGSGIVEVVKNGALAPEALSVDSEVDYNVRFDRNSIVFVGRRIRPEQTVYRATGEISVSSSGQQWLMNLREIQVNDDRVIIDDTNPRLDRITFLGDEFYCSPDDELSRAVFPNSLGGRCIIRITLSGDADTFQSDDLEDILRGFRLESLKGSISMFAGTRSLGQPPSWSVGIELIDLTVE